MTEVTPDPIMRLAMGFMAAKHLFVASEVGIFEKLAGIPATLEELAAKCGIPHRTLRISADAMVSLGLLEREGDRYCNSAVAAAFLAGGNGLDLRPMLRFWDKISYPAWLNLEVAVSNGQGQGDFFRFSEEEQQIFSTGVEAFSAGAASALAASYDFSPHRRVLDVAGGTGSFLIAILRRYPSLHGTLFELPGTCAVARQRLAREPEGAQIQLVEGNFLKDSLPDGHDVVIAANILHGLSETHNIDLLKNVREHVAIGVQLLLIDLWMDPTCTQPPAAPLMSGEFLVHSGEGQAYGKTRRRTGWPRLAGVRPNAGP